MIARVVSGGISPTNVDQAIGIYQASIMPDVKAAPGNVGVYLLTDRATGHSISITLWDSLASAQASEQDASFREHLAMVAQFFTSTPSIATYEVTAHS